MNILTEERSIKGRSHSQNQDCSYCQGHLIVVADGMGGEKAGEVASRITVDTITEAFSNSHNSQTIHQLMRGAISKADEKIIKHVEDHPDLMGMGTTVTIAFIQDNTLHVAWVGDSRAYVYNPQDGLKLLTKDHSYVQELVDKGEITLEETFSHPDNNLITRYVGGAQDCKLDYLEYKLGKKDIILLCTDGLSGYCKDEVIASAFNYDNPKDILDCLIDLALEHGSDDDITVAIAHPKPSLFQRIFG